MAVGNVLETAGNHLKACIVLYFNQLLSGGKALNRRSVYFLSYLVDLLWGRGGLRVRALAGDIVLCSWARHFTLTVSPPRCINGYRQI